MIDITAIITGAITLLMMVITTFLVPWLRTKTGAARWEQLVNAATVAAEAAEQLAETVHGREVVLAAGGKLEYATARVKAALAAQGVGYDDGTVRAAIEAAVRALNEGVAVYRV